MEDENETGKEIPLTNDEAASALLNQAHGIGEDAISSHEAFSNPGMYPFELMQMSLLLSIAHSLRSISDRLTALDPIVAAWSKPKRHVEESTEFI